MTLAALTFNFEDYTLDLTLGWLAKKIVEMRLSFFVVDKMTFGKEGYTKTGRTTKTDYFTF